MNESGVMKQVVKLAHNSAEKAGARRVLKLVVQIGQLSDVVPDIARECYPYAINGTLLEKCKLEIEVVPGIGICKQCDTSYNVVENEFKCPQCESDQWEIVSGHEVKIKDILAF